MCCILGAAKQETASCGPQNVALGIQKVGRGRTVSRVLYWCDRPSHSEYGTTPNDTQRLRAAAYEMRTGTQNLLSPSAGNRRMVAAL